MMNTTNSSQQRKEGIITMYEKLYFAIGLMVEDVGILGIAIIGLVLWAVISTMLEKKKNLPDEADIYKD